MLGIIEKLKNICEDNDNMNSKHAACIMRGSRPVIFANNNNRSYLHGKICSSGHAEQNAIISYFGGRLFFNGRKWTYGGYSKTNKRPLRKHKLLVIRINNKGVIRDSTPCAECIKLLKFTGLIKVSFSNKDGEIVTLNIEIIPEHYSKAHSRLFLFKDEEN